MVTLEKHSIHHFQRLAWIIGAGIAYANDRKRKFADVLISDQVENIVQHKKEGDEITNQGSRQEIEPDVQRVFEMSASDWSEIGSFTCADDDRTSVVHIGCIVSAPTLVRDEKLRGQLMKHTPYAIGGEMEGWVLLELKKELKREHNRDIDIIVIKGVADYGDLSKADEWQWTAAKAAMDCIHYCLSQTGGREFGGKETFHRNFNVGRNIAIRIVIRCYRIMSEPSIVLRSWKPYNGMYQ